MINGRAGIGEVWIVNLRDQTLEIYRNPHFSGSRRKIIFGSNSQVAPLAFLDAVVDVTELLKH